MGNLKRLSPACLALCLTWQTALAEPVRFEKRLLTVDANEGCAIADVNNDGKLDVIAGRNWYAAPDFTPRPLRLIEDVSGYVNSNGDYAWDVNGDGWTDVLASAFWMKEVCWYENPGKEGLQNGLIWKQHQLGETGITSNETQFLRDLDGDGTPEWISNDWSDGKPVWAWRLAKNAEGAPTIEKKVLSETGSGHGMGFGDINGDGLEDVLTGSGWLEQPKGGAFSGPWTFHADWKWHASCPVLVVDLNGDKRADIIRGEGHNYGLYWEEQLEPAADGATQWRSHPIDATWSQPHCLVWVDLDGDGANELLTGKRVRAHNGNDPGGGEPPCLYYYEWDGEKLEFARQTIDEGKIGTGLQIRTGDLNGDGRLDIAVPGKSGTYILLNQGK